MKTKFILVLASLTAVAASAGATELVGFGSLQRFDGLEYCPTNQKIPKNIASCSVILLRDAVVSSGDDSQSTLNVLIRAGVTMSDKKEKKNPVDGEFVANFMRALEAAKADETIPTDSFQTMWERLKAPKFLMKKMLKAIKTHTEPSTVAFGDIELGQTSVEIGGVSAVPAKVTLIVELNTDDGFGTTDHLKQTPSVGSPE